jgi:hypothetical protein
VTVCFGLFSRFGGARTAAATLAAGVATFVIATLVGFDYPFLLSLAVALLIYVGGALIEQPRQVVAKA